MMSSISQINEMIENYKDQDFMTFDQSPNGWRNLANNGKHLEAAKAIEDYLKHNTRKLTPIHTQLLNWHHGQLHGTMGNTEQALASMGKSYGDNKYDPQWNTYVKGTIQFLKKDKNNFDKTHKKATQENNYNLSSLDRLKKHFDKTYKEAYEA